MPVARTICAVLGVKTTPTENPVRIMGYVAARKQVDAQALLDSIQSYKHRHGIAEPVLLVVHQDLFRNGNSFVFGLARESVGAAVVSTARLRNEYYGLRENDDDLNDRIVKEGAHEIGHLLGLAHCDKPRMHHVQTRYARRTGSQEKDALPRLRKISGRPREDGMIPGSGENLKDML